MTGYTYSNSLYTTHTPTHHYGFVGAFGVMLFVLCCQLSAVACRSSFTFCLSFSHGEIVENMRRIDTRRIYNTISSLHQTHLNIVMLCTQSSQDHSIKYFSLYFSINKYIICLVGQILREKGQNQKKKKKIKVVTKSSEKSVKSCYVHRYKKKRIYPCSNQRLACRWEQ